MKKYNLVKISRKNHNLLPFSKENFFLQFNILYHIDEYIISVLTQLKHSNLLYFIYRMVGFYLQVEPHRPTRSPRELCSGVSC